MRVFSYVVRVDSGFAPNPFHGWCTLACCKPKVRERAQPGDLIVGLSSGCERVVYVMQVDEAMTFSEYWEDGRFRRKRALMSPRRRVERSGDNIYRPVPAGYEQQPSGHWDHENQREHLGNKARDTGVDRILAGREFAYWGGSGPRLPSKLAFLQVARGHRSRFTAAQIEAVRDFFEAAPRGVLGRPDLWPDADRTWSSRCG